MRARRIPLRSTLTVLVALVALLVPATAYAGGAEAPDDGAVPLTLAPQDSGALYYLDENGEAKAVGEHATVSGSSERVKWGGGTYVVDSDATLDGGVTCTGKVRLLLCDGAKLTVGNGIEVSLGDSLTVFAAGTSREVKGNGKLDVTGSAGVKAKKGSDGGPGGDGVSGGLTVYGGGVKIIGGDGGNSGVTYTSGVTVGGGGGSGVSGGLTVHGGEVKVSGGSGGIGGDGIGGQGGDGVSGGLAVRGGEVEVTGGQGGRKGPGGGISIPGGGGDGVSGGLTVSGGEVGVTGGDGGKGGRGLGGPGGHGVSGDLTVSDGKVKVTGGNGGQGHYASGYSGDDGGHGVSGSLTVSGGEVSATGGKFGTRSEYGCGVTGTVTYAPLNGQESDDGETWAKLESGEQSTKRYIRAGHFHAISYAADGAAITVTCTAPGCPIGGGSGKATLTISAPPAAIDGTGSYEATVSDPDGIRGGAEIRYYRAISGERAGDALAAAPTGTGTYRAEITLGEGAGAATAHVEYMLPKSPWAGSGTEASPYVIADAAGWDELSALVADGLDTTGMCFELGADVSVTTMVGTGASPFRGSLDGAGHTLTFNAEGAGGACAPFPYVHGAAFTNLRVAGTIETGGKCAAGLASISTGFTTVTNCVSDVDIVSAVNGDGTHGGFIALANDKSASDGCVAFEGCAFTGGISGKDTTSCGGFLGYDRSGGSSCTNCVLDAAVATRSGTATFIRYDGKVTEYHVTNCYYTRAVGQGRDLGKPANVVALPEGVTVAGGAAATYDVSGINAYATGMGYGGELVAAVGEYVRLAMDDLSASGGRFEVDGAELEREGDVWVLRIPDGEVSISRIEGIDGAKVVLSKSSLAYNGKVRKPSVRTVKGLTLKAGTDYDVSYAKGGKAVKSPKAVGTYTVTVTGKGSYAGTATATYKIVKAKNTMAAKAKATKKRPAAVSLSKLAKKSQTLKRSKVIALSKARGKVAYKKTGGNKKITISKKTGTVTVKKGLKAGTYKVKVALTAAGNSNYKKATKILAFYICVR